MNRILVPIDFSSSCTNALLYAQHLSKNLDMPLSLLHCYPLQEFNRPYDFGKKEYSSGIREMLKAFYKKHVNVEAGDIQFLTGEGSVNENVALRSKNYEVIVLSGNKFDSKFKRWLGSRASYIASMAQCPVLIIPPSAVYGTWDNIWQIKRNDDEPSIPGNYLERLKINPAKVEVKSFKQTTFTSALWRSAVAYVKTPKEALRHAISAATLGEKIDLIILVSQDKSSFQKFVCDDTMQVIFQYDIPVLVFQAKTIKWNKGLDA